MKHLKFVKYTVLTVLIFQNSGLTLTMRYSRVASPSSGLYISSTAVLLSELIKLIWSCLFFYRIDCEGNLSKFVKSLR